VRQAVAGNEIPWPSAAKVAILGGVLVAAVFVWRPWCTLLCPLGAIYALCNRFSFFFLRFHPERCVGCAECRSLCQGGDRPLDRVDTIRCVRCLECKQCRSVTVATSLRREAVATAAAASDKDNRPAPMIKTRLHDSESDQSVE
jgi:polyferredoxin